jgi:hypothetical protein
VERISAAEDNLMRFEKNESNNYANADYSMLWKHHKFK